VRSGVEYDTNAFRIAENPQPGWLTRYFGALDLHLASVGGGMLGATVQQGGKLFFERRRADVWLTQLSVTYRRPLVERWLSLRLEGDIKDRTERLSLRDYTGGGAGIGLDLRVGRFGLGAWGGWRFFAFKPNAAASYDGPSARAVARLFALDWLMFQAGWSYVRRRFDTPRIVDVVDGVAIASTSGLRRDGFHAVSAGTSLRGAVVLDLVYRLGLNRSNSLGQRITRHAVEVTLTAPLPLDVFASIHGELQRTSYDNPVYLDAIFDIDEDNRNALVASLARPLTERWEIEARYSLYVQEFVDAQGQTAAVAPPYRRQTFMVALAWIME
jgi:hypothetical protein